MGLLTNIVDAGTRLARTFGMLAPEKAPPSRQRRFTTPGPYWDRDPAMLGNTLTPQRLTRILTERNEGYLQGWADLADEAIEHNPHLFSQLTIRAQSTVETEFLVEPGEGSNQKAARRAAAMCKELVAHWRVREGGGLEDWLHDWVWSKYYGRSLHEILWERDGGMMLVEGLELLGTRRLSLACDADDPDPWALRIWDADGIDQTPFAGVFGRKVSEFGADKLIACEPRVRGSQKTREGLLSTVIWYDVFRTCSWRELMALEEMVSRPPVIAYYAAGGAKAASRGAGSHTFDGERMAGPEERNAAAKVVYAPTGALRALLPDTVHLEAMRYQLPTTDPVPILTSRECEALISKAINGVANLSDLKAGARAAVEAQERTSFTFWRADCRGIERLVGRIFSRVVKANPQRLGEDCPVPRLVAQVKAARDTEANGKRISTARSLGLKVPRKWAHQELEIPEPQDGEEVLEAATPSPAALPARQTQPEGEKGAPPGETPPTEPQTNAVALAAGASSSGVIVCLVPPRSVADDLAVPGGEAPEDLHVTLVHLGDVAALGDEQRAKLSIIAETFAQWFMPMTGRFNGVARFSAPDGTDAAVLTLDAPDLSAARERLVHALDAHGYQVSDAHGFVPHMTRAYVVRGEPMPGGDAIEPVPVMFTEVGIWIGGARCSFPQPQPFAQDAA